MPPLDPLLIGSFPVPPSHIPTSPNPPPSRPPSLPLPPVPGPSRISTTESFYLLSNPSTSTLSRSRSSSKVSESSSLDNARSSSSRPVSPASIRSGRAMTPHAGIEFLIQEHNARNDDLLNLDFELVGGPHDDVMDSEELLLHRTSPIHLRKAYHHRAANDSISSIDVSDILAATSNLSDSDEYHAHMATLTIPQGGQTLSRKQSTIARHRANSGLSLADPIDPSTLPASTPTKLSFPSTSPPSSPISPTSTTPLRIKKNHQIKEAPQKLPTPPSSPDIPSILASSTKTRPSNQRTRVESNASTSSLGYSQRARSKSRQRERTTSGGSSKSNASSSAYGGISTAYGKDTNTSGTGNQRQAHGGPMTVPRRMKGSSSGMSVKSLSSSESRVLEDRRSWIPHDEFGRPIPIPLMESPVPVSRPQSGESSWTGVDSRIEIAIERLEEAEKGEESGSDDSSIDLHTPLPHYMLKHGLLSPKSKLLQEFAEPSKSRNGRESVMSASSTKTGYSNLHDPRNTEKRRIRHRDGKLLKGGIGLTTGLGWSDSEDEDAPSALTRRLSTINLSRSTSFASLHSMRSTGSLQSSRSYYGKPSKKHLHNISSYSQSSSISASSHPALSKSFSAGMIYDAMEHDPMPPSLDELDEWGVIDAARFSNTTSNSLTPQADTFGLIPSPSAPAALSSFSTSISGGGFPKSLTMPNINSKLKLGGGMQRPNFNRKRSGSGSRLSTSTVGSVNSNTSAQSGMSASTSFSGFSGSRGIPEEDDELMMKTTTSIGMGPPSSPTQSKFRAQTMGGRKGYKYSKTPSGSISSAAAVQAEKISHSNSTSTSGSNGLSSSPSTSSSRSIPLPVTPSDDAMFDEAATVNSSSSTTLPGVGLQIPAPNKDKVLPPLPPTLRRIPGKKELNLDASDTFMSTPVSGSKMAEFGYGGSDRKDESVRSTVTPKNLGVSGSLNSRTRAGSNTSSASSGIATPAGRKTPTGIRTPGAQSSLPSAMATPRPLRLASSPNVNATPTPANHGGSRDRAPVPVPSIHSATVPAASSGLPKPAASPALRSTTPSSAPAGSTSFRSRLNSSSVTLSTPGSPVPSALAPGERKPRTGTGMVYRTSSSVGPSKLRLPAVAAANGNLGASASGIARPARSTGPVAF